MNDMNFPRLPTKRESSSIGSEWDARSDEIHTWATAFVLGDVIAPEFSVSLV